MLLSRRQFITLAGAGAASAVLLSRLKSLYTREARGESVIGQGYGPLQTDPDGLLDLPSGFQYRAFSRTGETMSDGTSVPGGHDGMAAFAGARNTTILVRNHELSPNSSSKVAAPASQKYDPLCGGGTTTLIVGPDRQLIRDYTSLAGTYRNCAGGSTPWGSWISCEENTSTPAHNQPNDLNNVSKPHGYNFEVPAINRKRVVNPIPLVAMGRFNHEAIAVDPRTGIVYQTEDRRDSLFYRFLPKQPGNLQAGGVLEALKIQNMPQAITRTNFPVGEPMQVEWVRIEDVNPMEDSVRVEGFTNGAAQFSRGEGITYGNGEVYFTCTNGGNTGKGQVWCYIPGKSAQAGGTIELFVEPNEQSVLENPDNITVSPHGDLFMGEDGDGTNYIVGVTPQGKLYQFARNATNDSEFAGVCFSPDGKTMFLNIQNPGITFAIWGPWT
jgi:secreted PhoX family phosphatase